MCGIVGFCCFETNNSDAIIRSMTDELHHRGPDDTGFWIDDDIGLVLGHKRLSIMDLSGAGHQPMSSPSGRYVMVFNGEIYNHLILRSEISTLHEELNWKSHSDTETLLACFELWGIERTLKASVGMFAIALYDRVEKKLVLARDRLGEKPLYYGLQGNVLFFGSELKAFRRHPGFKSIIDRNALSLYFKNGVVPAPYSIYKDIYKLMPGHFMCISLSSDNLSHAIEKSHEYWSLNEVAKSAVTKPFLGSDDSAIDALESVLINSVSDQMISDVPIGAFLSGGVDSSLIVALMQSVATNPVKTFTIGFDGVDFNEAEHAKKVSSYLGTEHTELYVQSSDALSVVPDLPKIWDEPFSDSSQIPTLLVSRLASSCVKVSISGDGGDEVFGGYSKYRFLPGRYQKINKIPYPLRHSFSKIFSIVGSSLPDVLKRQTLLKTGKTSTEIISQISLMLSAKNFHDMHDKVTSLLVKHDDLVIGFDSKHNVISDEFSSIDVKDFQEWMMAYDTLTYLHDDILVKVDRASMSASLETRAPFLDHRVVEFAWALPLNMKIRSNEGKWILKEILYEYVPKALVDRPKHGFGVPLSDWLCGPLRGWAEDLLDKELIIRQGYLNYEIVNSMWTEHLFGIRKWHHQLWAVLMFQQWLLVNE